MCRLNISLEDADSSRLMRICMFAHSVPIWLQAAGRNLRFLANVDPVDVARALNGLKQETTLVVVVSKTFTTAETMLNARTVR